ncbi:M16 family metallopeptidase [Ralstonia nicotianae]
MRAMSLTLKTFLAGMLAAAAHGALAALPIEHWTAATGARVFFVPSPSIPMLDINLDVDAGTRYEPAAKVGLASLTAGMLDKGVAAVGSTPARDEAAIADAFADVGASFSGGAGGDRTSLHLRTLSDPAERKPAVDLMAQIVAAPTVPDAVLTRDKQRTVAAIRESLTKPQVLADRAFGTAIYGTHPYGQSATPDTVQSITRDDILRFYHANYTAKRAVVTLIGAISRQEAEAIAEQVTRGLPPDGATPPALPAVDAPLAKADTVRIAHPAQQATIVMGQPGIARSDKDYFPLLVGNYVLGGGGFSSRLTNEVREKRGLTYSIGSYFAPAAQLGPFELALQTRKDQTEQALTVVRDTVVRFVAEGPTDAELKAAKDNLVNGFPLRLDSNRKLLDNVANIAWYNLPLDYLDTWTQRVAAVTREQVRVAFQRVLQPQTMATIVVGGPAPH